MPYLMRDRNESAVYHETLYGIGPARRWLKAYNLAHPQRATLFHLFAYACAQALHARPGLNRSSRAGGSTSATRFPSRSPPSGR